MFLRLAACAVVVMSPCMIAAAQSQSESLSLDEAVSRVARNHPDLRLPEIEQDVARARLHSALQKPALVFDVQIENALGTGDARGLRGAETTVTLSGVLERTGKLDARRTLAQANIDALAPQREINRLDMMAEVARRYLAISVAQAQQAIAAEDIQQRQRVVAAARLRLQAGASPESTLLTAEAALAQAELDRDRALQADRAARMALALLWNSTDAEFQHVSGDPYYLPALQDASVLRSLLEGTPELAALAGEARVREAQLHLARSASRADLSWQVGVRNLRERGDNALVAGFSLPLGSAARAAPDIRAAQAELAMAPLQRQSRLLQLGATLTEAHGRYAVARMEVGRLGSDVLPRLQRAERAAEAAWRAGAISYLEWAQLQAMRIEARQRQLDAALAAQTALIELQRLSGQSLVAATEGTLP